MHFPPDIVTARLRLVSIAPKLLRAEPSALAQLLQAEVPSAWPPEHWEPHVFDLLEDQYRTLPVTVGWNRYIVLPGETPMLIGTIGAFAKPDAEAEIGYSVLPEWQCRGFATESLRMLLPKIFESEFVQRISAHTFPQLTASIRVLEKCGFSFSGPGQEEGTIRYQIDRSPFAGMNAPKSLSGST